MYFKSKLKRLDFTDHHGTGVSDKVEGKIGKAKVVASIVW